MKDKKKYQKKQLLKFYQDMLRIRKMEEKIYQLYTEAKMYGMSPHLYVGEEAVAVGVCHNLRKDDYIVSTHRGHGHCLAKGGDIKGIIAEILGKKTGYCCGLGGSMHIADVANGNLGANGIVGAGLPIATGAGLSIKYRETDQVAVCFFGDAAANHGTFHESLNFATAFKLPVVFVCENNIYGLSTTYKNVSATADIVDRASAYNIPGLMVDGMSVLDVYENSKTLIKRARSGKGPSLMECKTYRFFGHGASDHKPYRTKEEEQVWMRQCPVDSYKAELLHQLKISTKDIVEIDKKIEKEILDAVEYAFNSPEPDFKLVEESIFYERNNV